MSQSGTQSDDGSTDDSDTNLPPLAQVIADVRGRLEALEEDGVSDMDDVSLVELRTELKQLEDRAEGVRKGTADAELRNRVEPGEELLGLKHVESHKKYVTEDPSTVIARAVGQGIEYDQFVSIKASALVDVAPELAEVGRNEYTYFR